MEQLTARFFSLVAPDLPNEWDVEEAVEHLEGLSEDLLDAVFSQVRVIWPVSNSLCFSYFSQVAAALACIRPEQLSQWVNETLDQYEQSGLRAAQRFMMDVQGRFVCRLQGRSGLNFSQVEGRLLPYARGLAAGNIDLEQSRDTGTDTATIFLPAQLSLFDSEEDNFRFYKLTVSFQWSFIQLGSFLVSRDRQVMNPSARGRLWLEEHCSRLAEPELFLALYHDIETLRARVFLDRELPGLMRDARSLLQSCAPPQAASTEEFFFTFLKRLICGVEPGSAPGFEQQFQEILAGRTTAPQSLDLAEAIYETLAGHEWPETALTPLQFQGRPMLERVAAARMEQRQERETAFIDGLAALILQLPPVEPDVDSSGSEDAGWLSSPGRDASALVLGNNSDPEAGSENFEPPQHLSIDGREIELSEELAELAAGIEQDLGSIPDRYIDSAVGRAGQGDPSLLKIVPADGEALSAPITYDEWDYRRSGFRRNWCIVTEKEIPLLRSTFIRNTLATYRGQIIRLRHQFEMMRTTERFVRRQRDGDDIDLDALVESLADTVAGHPPSDRLFIRLKRDERDIAALFLVDMSNSTRGWVGRGIKESLVLICEATETLGDRYGIYGFSGMRRLRCEIFPIKNIEEPYSDEVRERIGSIAPREYTRMAPAIRHLTSILEKVDARVRLLITLSDGKPEDYDDYKGEYAIEDTRHALIEAKMAGIHPFCITIDQHAHEYMAHMYGEVNYIFINDVRRLPARMPEIYRVLTT